MKSLRRGITVFPAMAESPLGTKQLKNGIFPYLTRFGNHLKTTQTITIIFPISFAGLVLFSLQLGHSKHLECLNIPTKEKKKTSANETCSNFISSKQSLTLLSQVTAEL